MHNNRIRIHPTSIEGFVFLLSSVLLAVYSLVMHDLSHAKWKMSPYLFPLLLAVFLFLLSLSLLLEGRKEGQVQVLQDSEQQRQEVSLLKKGWKDATVFALIALVYILCIPLISFVVATALFLVGSFVYLKERRIALVIILSIAFPLIVFVLFGMLLHVMLP